jgi:hypothetical protein
MILTNYLSECEVMHMFGRRRGFDNVTTMMRDHDFPAPDTWVHRRGPHWDPVTVKKWARFYDATVAAIERAKPHRKSLEQWANDLAEKLKKAP